MTSPIAATSPAAHIVEPQTRTVPRAGPERVLRNAQATREQEIQKAAQQFEAIFARELLKVAKPFGSAGNGPYGHYMLESMADAMTQGRGLGMADRIARELGGGQRKRAPSVPATATTTIAPAVPIPSTPSVKATPAAGPARPVHDLDGI